MKLLVLAVCIFGVASAASFWNRGRPDGGDRNGDRPDGGDRTGDRPQGPDPFRDLVKLCADMALKALDSGADERDWDDVFGVLAPECEKILASLEELEDRGRKQNKGDDANGPRGTGAPKGDAKRPRPNGDSDDGAKRPPPTGASNDGAKRPLPSGPPPAKQDRGVKGPRGTGAPKGDAKRPRPNGDSDDGAKRPPPTGASNDGTKRPPHSRPPPKQDRGVSPPPIPEEAARLMRICKGFAEMAKKKEERSDKDADIKASVEAMEAVCELAVAEMKKAE